MTTAALRKIIHFVRFKHTREKKSRVGKGLEEVELQLVPKLYLGTWMLAKFNLAVRGRSQVQLGDERKNQGIVWD